MKVKYLNIGKIVSTHGLKGELRVYPLCDDFDFFSHFKKVYLGEEYREFEVESSRPQKNIFLLKLVNVDSIDIANTLRDMSIYAKRDEAPKLELNKFYICEIKGMKVVDNDTGKEYGKLTDVMVMPANDVWQITKNGKEYLLPAIKDVISSVDFEANVIKIVPMKGIFEDED
ncbi:MAG: ribosome maturation factor RimM [Clostridia bacterium]|nr:ribosome maturation factor RimM [Clostridia bacterium]